MLDIASSSHSKPGVDGSSTPSGGKRIPASLMKMRRESLSVAGKYKLPIIDATKLPDNSLVSMASMTNKNGEGQAASSSAAALPAFCTPKRHTPKSLKATLDLATSQITSADLLEVGSINKRLSAEVSVGSGGSGGSGGSSDSRGGGSGHHRRSLSSDGCGGIPTSSQSSKDIDTLIKNGLATPRRSSRRSIRMPASSVSAAVSAAVSDAKTAAASAAAMKEQSTRRLSKFKNHNSKTNDDGGDRNSSSDDRNDSHSLGGSSNHSGSVASRTSCGTSSSSRQQRHGGLRRNKTMDESATTSRNRTVDVLCTPRRSGSARKVTIPGVRRSNTTSKLPTTKISSSSCGASSTSSSKKQQHKEEEHHEDSTFSTLDDDISEMTPILVAPVAPTASLFWTCTCGEKDNGMDCKFCGMCGTPQRWECADCSYANKCKFRFCGMCGIPKKVKGEEQQ